MVSTRIPPEGRVVRARFRIGPAASIELLVARSGKTYLDWSGDVVAGDLLMWWPVDSLGVAVYGRGGRPAPVVPIGRKR